MTSLAQVNVSGIDDVMKSLRAEVKIQAGKQTGNVSHRLVNQLAEATPIDTGRASQGWELRQIDDETYVINNDVEYVEYLNAGSSKQAPAFFVEQTILNNPEVKPNGVIVTYR